jgi:membrane-bound lytic murein transglycosylase D
MRRAEIIGCMLLIVFFLIGCAIDRSAKREPEKVIVQAESSEKADSLVEKLRTLEHSISSLRSELEKLEALQNSLTILRSEVERLSALETSNTTLRSEVASLEGRLRSIHARPPLSSYRLPQEVSLCGERVPLEDRNVWENLDREFLVTLDSEAQVLLWMKRAKRYFPHIEKKLKEMGLPDDLKYITITESGLRPYAVSSSGASGIWQFIASTGEKYGMKRNRVIDERFDFFKATEGALTYLKSLYEEFKSWTLAMAAYNAGENRVRKEIDLQKTKDYFYLDLPMETERYVYKIAVAKVILSEPEKYGFHLEKNEFYDLLQVERVPIELTQPLPIIDVARAVGFFYKEIKEMNPQLSEETIPPGTHVLNLPPGTSERFWDFFFAWKKEMESKPR